MDEALKIFEEIGNKYLVSRIHKEIGDMHKEVFEIEEAQRAYDKSIELRKSLYSPEHIVVSKLYCKLADNYMRERGNMAYLE